VNGCPIHGWSVIASASMESQLAGVLAGFVFTGIVLLFGRRGARSTQALGLFCAAFVVLGFDSLLYGLISGEGSDHFCARVWSEGMAAAGMLAVGAMAIITGISWLLASHMEEVAEPHEDSLKDRSAKVIDLDRLVRLMAYGVGVGVMLLLAAVAYDYLAIVFRSPPELLVWAIAVSLIFVVIVIVGSAFLWRYVLHDSNNERNLVSNVGLRVAAYGTLGYAVVGPFFATLESEFGVSWWRPVSGVVITEALTAGLFVPGLLIIALVHAVPPLYVEEDKPRPRREHVSSAPSPSA
jgi:hypothetical protein